jgi:hypothetical protein
MKKNFFSATLFILAFIVAGTVSCKKSSGNSDSITAIAGTWYVTEWGGYSDTVTMIISTTNKSAIMATIPLAASQGTNWFSGDSVFANIVTVSGGTYNCMGRYEDLNVAYYTKAVLSFTNDNTILTATYSTDPNTGITPPQYVWYKYP